MSDSSSQPADANKRSRQKATLIVLAVVLILGGLVVLLLLRRMPLPLRLVVSFGDFVAASALLLFLRQNYSGK
jgi:hypothetical protein